MIYQLLYRGDVISDAITEEDAVHIAAELAKQGIKTRIVEPWVDGKIRIETINNKSALVFWRTEKAYYSLAIDRVSNKAFDYGAFGVPISQRYVFDHKTQAAVSALGAGEAAESIGIPPAFEAAS